MCYPTLSHGSGMNSGSHSCRASTLSSELSLQHAICTLKRKTFKNCLMLKENKSIHKTWGISVNVLKEKYIHKYSYKKKHTKSRTLELH